MERILLDEIMDAIENAKYKDRGDKYETKILYNKNHLSALRIVIEKVIREHDEKYKEHEMEMAKLSAKVFAYEAIIANSNFAPMIFNQAVLNFKEGEE